MKIRKFIGKNFQDAFMKMKEEMGEDAIILSSRKLPGKPGTAQKPGYEVTAVLDEKTLNMGSTGIKPEAAVEKYQQMQSGTSAASLNRPPQKPEPAEKPLLKDGKEFINQLQHFSQIETIKEELSGLKTSLDGMMEFIKDSHLPALPENLKILYKKLVEMEVQENLSRTIVQTILAQLSAADIQDKDILGTFLKKVFSSVVKIAPPVEKVKTRRQLVAALVGPTGVGKTTTVAKIAANCKILHGKKVGIITADTFRIAAVEQIQTFANIAGIPIEVVYEPSEVKYALKELQDMDVVLMDTVGRSHKKSEQLQKIKEFIDAADAQQVHLVMSLTSSTKNLLNVAQQFSIMNPNRYIFSKLDEVSGAGNLLNTVYKMKQPVSYITTGQNVPDDLLYPDSNILSRLLLYGLN